MSLPVEAALSTMADGTKSGLELEQHLEPGSWAVSGTGHWGTVKLWHWFLCFFFSRLDPAGVGSALLGWFCIVERKKQTCWALKPAAPICRICPETIQRWEAFSWRPEASKETREKSKASALAQRSNSFNNLARMKRETGSAWVSFNSQSDPGTSLLPELRARQLGSDSGPWVLERQWQAWAYDAAQVLNTVNIFWVTQDSLLFESIVPESLQVSSLSSVYCLFFQWILIRCVSQLRTTKFT